MNFRQKVVKQEFLKVTLCFEITVLATVFECSAVLKIEAPRFIHSPRTITKTGLFEI